MHDWSEKHFDWKGLNDAGHYIETNLLRWGRVNIRDVKEKYGTLRIYLSFGWHQLHSFTHPRYIYSRYPQWLWILDCLYFSKFFRLLNFIIVPYHQFLYRFFYKKAVEKWPHLTAEILCCADYDELLEGVAPDWERKHAEEQAEYNRKLEAEGDEDEEVDA